MITEIVELIIDVSNAFGSLCSCLRMKYKKYDVIIKHHPPMDMDKVEQLYSMYPKLKTEVNIYKQKAVYVVVDSSTIKKSKRTLSVVFLNEGCKYIHGFSILQKNVVTPDLDVPCYWQI